MAMVTYIAEYVDEDGLLDEACLEKRCRVFYEGFKSFERPMATLLEELEAGFAESFEEPLVSIPQTDVRSTRWRSSCWQIKGLRRKRKSQRKKVL